MPAGRAWVLSFLVWTDLALGPQWGSRGHVRLPEASDRVHGQHETLLKEISDVLSY
jgi:hypothetical protein